MRLAIVLWQFGGRRGMGMGKRDTTIGIVFYKNICHRHRSKGNCLSINDSSGDSKW
mgnify:CR=1 FL=1|jgi:hypothetical protein